MIEKIKTIHLQKFKSFKETTIELKNFNIFVGANNSGKSTILYAIRLFFSLSRTGFRGPASDISFHSYYTDITRLIPLADFSELWYLHKKTSKETNGIIMTLTFCSDLQLQLIMTEMFGQTHISGKCLNNPNGLSGDKISDVLNAQIVFISGLQGILPRESYVTPARIHALVNESRYIEIFRSALLNLKNSNSYNFNLLNTVLEKYLGIKITKISFDPNSDEYLHVEYQKGENSFDISNAGSGMQQIIQMLTHLYLNDPDIILIDEPDAHLHPELQGKIGVMLKDFAESKGSQLFIATHSPEIIDIYENKEVFLIDNTRPRIVSIGKDNAFVGRLFEEGILTSSSLTNLAIRPNCFVYEDENSIYFKKIASLLNCNIFNELGKTKASKGVSRFNYIFDIYKGVSKIIGRNLILYFLQDRDGIPDKYIDFIKNKYQTDSIKTVHILQRHEIENYFIEVSLILRAIRSKLPVSQTVSVADIENLIKQVASQSITSLQRNIKDRCIAAAHFCNNPEGKNDIEIEDECNQYFLELNFRDIPTIQKNIGGKEFFSKMHEIVAERYHINFSINDCVNISSASDLNDELRDFFQQFS